jgi:hypothetical protein
VPHAYVALGQVVHLIQDLHLTSHVLDDLHGPEPFGGRDSLEEWCQKTDYPDIRRKQNESNIRIWNSKPLKPPVVDETWDKSNTDQKLREFVHAIIVDTQRFRSADC